MGSMLLPEHQFIKPRTLAEGLNVLRDSTDEVEPQGRATELVHAALLDGLRQLLCLRDDLEARHPRLEPRHQVRAAVRVVPAPSDSPGRRNARRTETDRRIADRTNYLTRRGFD